MHRPSLPPLLGALACRDGDAKRCLHSISREKKRKKLTPASPPPRSNRRHHRNKKKGVLWQARSPRRRRQGTRSTSSIIIIIIIIVITIIIVTGPAEDGSSHSASVRESVHTCPCGVARWDAMRHSIYAMCVSMLLWCCSAARRRGLPSVFEHALVTRIICVAKWM